MGRWRSITQFDAASNRLWPARALAPVKLGQWGYVNTSGKLEINPQFDWAGGFSEGLAAVQMGGHFGYVNADGSKYADQPAI